MTYKHPASDIGWAIYTAPDLSAVWELLGVIPLSNIQNPGPVDGGTPESSISTIDGGTPEFSTGDIINGGEP